jgi:ADP-ribosyl-[dinitrogen reductase] hydrolase
LISPQYVCFQTQDGNPVKSALFGVAVGDALGVPAEFTRRETLRRNPITGVTAFGSHNMPAGTWSDDSSLTFCLAESLTRGFNLHDIAQNFVKWQTQNFWTARGCVFDIGAATQHAINRLRAGADPTTSGGNTETDNGNGSLMRILPLLFHIHTMPVEARFEHTRLVSAITHAHIRSVIACFYYLEFARGLLYGQQPSDIYVRLQHEVGSFLRAQNIDPSEVALFDRLLRDNIADVSEHDISSSGYVLHTLEASIWCLLTTDSYAEAVLKAINLGADTDTTAAVTGGLAGLHYGFDAIPTDWLTDLAKIDDIESLSHLINVYIN